MTALEDAKVHLTKAREFLDAAEADQDLELYNAATSDAVTSGINSKGAICLVLDGPPTSRTTSRLSPNSRVPAVPEPTWRRR